MLVYRRVIACISLPKSLFRGGRCLMGAQSTGRITGCVRLEFCKKPTVHCTPPKTNSLPESAAPLKQGSWKPISGYSYFDVGWCISLSQFDGFFLGWDAICFSWILYQNQPDLYLEPQTTSLKWMFGETWWNNHFLCKDLESSNWIQLKQSYNMVVWGSW